MTCLAPAPVPRTAAPAAPPGRLLVVDDHAAARASMSDVLRQAGHRQAWLSVVAGNARARRFYERSGWIDDGPFEYLADGPVGPIAVAAHRYVKAL